MNANANGGTTSSPSSPLLPLPIPLLTLNGLFVGSAWTSAQRSMMRVQTGLMAGTVTSGRGTTQLGTVCIDVKMDC